MRSAKSEVSAIALRIWAAEGDLGILLRERGIEPDHSCVAGEPRFSPKGTALSGVYLDSFAIVRYDVADPDSLPVSIESVLDRLKKTGWQLAEFVRDGGRAELFIGWDFFANSGDVIDWRLLKRLADECLSLSLEVYPVASDVEED